MANKATLTMSDKEYQDWTEYAEARGLKNIPGLIRFAIVAYISRYPLKKEEEREGK